MPACRAFSKGVPYEAKYPDPYPTGRRNPLPRGAQPGAGGGRNQVLRRSARRIHRAAPRGGESPRREGRQHRGGLRPPKESDDPALN